MKQKNKILPITRAYIANVCKQLPDVPFFMEGKNGMVPQRISSGKRISAAQLTNEQIKEIGVSPSGIYTQKNYSVRMMNHKVNLNKVYADDGNDGIEGYIAYVNQLYAWISKQREPKGAEGEVSAVSMQQEEHLQNQPETEITTSDENN